MRPPRFPALMLLLAGLLLLVAEQAFGCPNCKEAIAAQTGDAARLKDGYFYSILFMMAMPFLLAGTATFLVVRAVRKGALPPL